MPFAVNKYTSRGDPALKRTAENMAIKHIISREKSQPIQLKNRDKHAVMTARTEGGILPMSTNWKTKKSGN